MKRYLSILNQRTLFTLILSIVIPFLAFEFEIFYHIDLTLISLAIIFPLVFAIRGAFKRREKSLQFLSQFRSSLKTIYYFFNSNSKLSISKKEEINNILHEISNHLLIIFLNPVIILLTLIKKLKIFLNSYLIMKRIFLTA